MLGIKTREYIEFDTSLLGRKIELTVHRVTGEGTYRKTKDKYVGVITSVAPSNLVFCYRDHVGYELSFKTVTADTLFLPQNTTRKHAYLYELDVKEVVL